MNQKSDIQKDSIERVDLAHNDFFEYLRKNEYARLDEHQHTYLDYTGGGLYAKSQIESHFKLLTQNILGNPHSTNPSSLLATQLVAEARQKVLDFFNAKEYYSIFTQNASNALKIIGECYPFNTNSHFMLLADNHNSVNGIREFCLSKGGKVTYAPIYFENLRMDENFVQSRLENNEEFEDKLFAFPAQSNVSGVKHDLKWIKIAQDKGWDVLLDAAAFVPSNKLDLSLYHPDFVCVSFYKIFGYPTGLGCLLVKKDKFEKLHKPWFAGGTVSFVSVNALHYSLIGNHERFEDGTLNYLDIPAIKTGLDYIESIGIDKINERVATLRSYLCKALTELKHDNGKEVVKISGPTDNRNVGGTMILSFYNVDGKRYDFEEIELLANKINISSRSGCFCNPGIDETNSCLTAEEISKYYTSNSSGTYEYKDMERFFGRMRGATRISVGIATTQKDLDVFVNFVKSLLNK
ncbi:MAG: aminotransferase class V-fold PLP-dependent enzyme [Bacteroidetes bacterium]|nr:aminotransferase class V-fold PLP-dependent enzyme [Bacteroidota bacterium]